MGYPGRIDLGPHSAGEPVAQLALVFVNTSVSGAIAIIPASANIALLQGQYPGIITPAIAVINGAGSLTMQPGDKFIIDTIVCTCAWNGIASGTGSVLTILEA